MKKTMSFFALILITIFVFVQPALAVSTPNFPSCTNPQGEVIASYENGKHGIPGESRDYKGSDIVYRLPQGHVTQCFCAKDGDGIQTNWWKADSLDADQIKTLERSGWDYIPNGTAWGLDESSYMTKNIEYECLGTGGGDVEGTSSESHSDSDSRSIGQVLGLASTGNSEFLYNLWLAGLITLICGICLKKVSQKLQK